ncbi:hypothetical protein [Jiangella alba]|uniref:Uncharacterized protein n=1 Tax=Jiangella alba TaxID=561176 RepID=A0A1H5D8N2_9ACTN|nr:hypothetical protein [Jiangella alba]SED75138.1 hypothetical protein SAMN04488561_0329 [Jiangella alba]
MTQTGSRAALDRVVRRAGGASVFEALVALPGSDLTTLQLELMRRRAAALSPATVLERYRRDRFTAPAPLPFAALRRVEDVLLDALAARPESVEVVTPAPLAPLGTHSVLATVDQNKVVSTVRGTDVAADPTNGLALEAAVRRQDLQRADVAGAGSGPGGGPLAGVVRLAAIQRVVRAQYVAGPAMFAHFSLFAQVTAGRDIGGLGFERAALAEQLAVVAGALPRLGAEEVEVRLTVLEPRFAPVADAIVAALGGRPDGAAAGVPVRAALDPGRPSGRGYYEGLCFKVMARLDGEWAEVGDGGFTGWSRELLSNKKERLLISGLGIDRLAAAHAAATSRTTAT